MRVHGPHLNWAPLEGQHQAARHSALPVPMATAEGRGRRPLIPYCPGAFECSNWEGPFGLLSRPRRLPALGDWPGTGSPQRAPPPEGKERENVPGAVRGVKLLEATGLWNKWSPYPAYHPRKPTLLTLGQLGGSGRQRNGLQPRGRPSRGRGASPGVKTRPLTPGAGQQRPE